MLRGMDDAVEPKPKDDRDQIEAGAAEYKLDQMLVFDLPKTEWAKMLVKRYCYFKGTQHDHHEANWDGQPRDSGASYMGERWFPGSTPGTPHGFTRMEAVTPYGMRRPDAPFPLGRQIVRRFTEMMYGEKRRPRLRVRADANTERSLHAVFAESDAWDALTEMRDFAGGCGCGVVSLSVINGEPCTKAHKPWEILPLKWCDSARRRLEWVIEQKLVDRTEIIPGKGVVTTKYWETKEWTPTHVRTYKPVPEKHDREKPLELLDERKHGCDGVPMVWVRNTRATALAVGSHDYEGVEELLDKVDRMQSQTAKATIANVDPTLKLKRRRSPRRHNQIKLGAGNAIDLGPEDDAEYLELAGTSIEMGWRSIYNLRDEILQTVGCVLVDPTTAGKGQSGEALEKLWRSMEARVDRLRTPNNSALQDLCTKWLGLMRKWGIARKDLERKSPEQAAEDGCEANDGGILLPPWVETEDDPESLEANEAKLHRHKVGKGNHVECVWPPHHSPTAQQIGQLAQGLSVASGGQALVSRETASHHMAAAMGQEDPGSEFRRLQKEEEKRAEEQPSMFPDDGTDDDEVEVEEDDDLDLEDEVGDDEDGLEGDDQN